MVVAFSPRWWGAFLLCWAVVGNGITVASVISHDFIDHANDQLDSIIDLHNLQGQSVDVQAPEDSQGHVHFKHGDQHAQGRLHRRHIHDAQLQPRVDRVPLRLLSLGSSIVEGVASTNHNGFRYALRSALVADGHKVNMVGSQSVGSMGDNQNEGWAGYRIDQVALKADLSLPTLPNVVCILAGGNDVYQRFNTNEMSKRMGDLIDKILNAVPGTTVIVSTLMRNWDARNDAIMVVYNANLTQVVASRASAGKKVFLVNNNSTWWNLEADILPSNHPNDAGYLKMARVFYDGIVKARSGITTAATPVGGIDDSSPPDLIGGNACDKDPANEKGPIRTGLESGSNDGPYVHSQTLHTIVRDMTKMGGGGTSAALFWADINGDGLDDYVNVHADMKQLSVALNLGSGNFAAAITLDVSNVVCARANVKFADIGGDGRDDLCCIATDGSISCATNKYATGVAKPFSNLATFAAAVAGSPGSRNRLADIDGDGRADRLIIKDNGDIEGWRNTVTGTLLSIGIISSGKVFTDLDGIRLIDINGDGRADLLWLDDTGKATTWINQRGFVAGSIAPTWVAVGTTYPGTGVAKSRPLITFGKVYGATRNDPIFGVIKPDVIVAKDPTGKASTFQVYENTGKGSLRLNADGVHFCDMRGTGSEDYVWVTREGIVRLFGNQHAPPAYKSYGDIFKANRNRQEVHLADLDGDGKCDILLVDKATGAVTMQRNDFNTTTDKFAFTNMGVVSNGATCTEGYGKRIVDLGVRFADITGDGKADYLCIKSTGEAFGFINNGLNNFKSVGSVRRPTNVERADVRFADVNGDGRADFLTIEPFTGALTARINNYNNKTGAIGWTDKGVISPGGRARGASVFLANLNGTGRADYVIVAPTTAIQDTWYNFCPNSASPLRAPTVLAPDPSNPDSK